MFWKAVYVNIYIYITIDLTYLSTGKMTGSGKLQCVKVAQVNYNSASPDLVKQSNVSMSKFVLQLNEQ